MICIGSEWARFQEVVDIMAELSCPADEAIEIVFAFAAEEAAREYPVR